MMELDVPRYTWEVRVGTPKPAMRSHSVLQEMMKFKEEVVSQVGKVKKYI